ncbi:aromatic ring-hydroxylating oxygenase subunit alpha [Pseudonocardia kongjuensis]|uniref:aromatic ring-hydroxylating oxygenase subunit alpha n=1 Tax=Pseudonocardia kongjuensis TaxID=102227 RepID=UPI0031D8F995
MGADVRSTDRPRVDVLLERMGEDLDRGLVPAEVFNDESVHQRELRRIFGRCWIYIGHESELPDPGDYHVRRIGEDPFVFVRDENGTIRVLLNSCRHRGSVVCRVDSGNTSHFRCPYHAWTYKNDGTLIGVPARQNGYRALDMSQWGLLPAAQVDSFHGLVFATLDPAAPPLHDYLGKFRWYLEMSVALTEGGMEVLGEPHRWLIDADWKSGAENFTGDSSHTQMTHRSLLEVGIADQAGAGKTGKAHGLHVNECDGHAISMRVLAPGEERWFDYPKELQVLIEEGGLSEPQLDLVRRGVVHDGTVFPNLSFIQFSAREDIELPPTPFVSIRTWQPRGPGRMEVWSWLLAPREASPEFKERMYRAGMASFSPSGAFEQDDAIVWSGVARTGGSVAAELQGIRFNYQMGMPGMGDAEPIEDWPGPGVAWPSNSGESGLRTFHRRWYEQMTAGPADGE